MDKALMVKSKSSNSDVSRQNLLSSTATKGAQRIHEESNEAELDTNRRGLIRGLVTSVASVVGLSSIASAQHPSSETPSVSSIEERKATQGYRNQATVEALLSEHQHLLGELAADDLLDSAAVNEVNLHSVRPPRPSRDGEGVRFTAQRIGGRVRPEIRIYQKPPEGVLTIAIFPEDDHSYAVLNPDGDTKGPVEYGDETFPVGNEPATNGGEATAISPEPQECLFGKCYECHFVYSCCDCCTCPPCPPSTCDPAYSCTCAYCREYYCGCYCCKCGILCSSYC